MRLQLSIVLAMLGFSLAACQQQAGIFSDREANNPFKYTKRSAVCKLTPLVKQKDGSLITTMMVRSDDGQCQFTVEQENPKGAYLSFGLLTVPENGKTFIYNYDNRTYIRYMPTVAYAGSDKFIAKLIHQNAIDNTQVTVNVTVDNTGVQVPKPAVQAPPSAVTTKVTTHRKKTAVRHAVKKKTQ